MKPNVLGNTDLVMYVYIFSLKTLLRDEPSTKYHTELWEAYE